MTLGAIFASRGIWWSISKNNTLVYRSNREILGGFVYNEQSK